MVNIRPFIFFSYAHTPRIHQGEDPDVWITQLYEKLCEHIVNITDTENPGFIDRHIADGQLWAPELAEALSTCRIFVPLYSPRYFKSMPCGREWAAFARRVTDQAVKESVALEGIVPALWTRMKRASLPGVASKRQINDLGEPFYADEGFYGIIKLKRYSALYERATYKLAWEIVEAAERSHISPSTPARFEALASAFGQSSEKERPMRITVSALTNSEQLPTGRTTRYYGRAARDWNPYVPTSKKPLADYASELVSCVGYEAQIGTLDDHLDEISAEGKPTRPGLVLVDPWVAMHRERRQGLERLDASARLCTEVLVPWSNEDPETLHAAEPLKVALSGSLNRTFESVLPAHRMAVSGLPTIESFGDAATSLALTAGQDYLKLVMKDVPASGLDRLKLTAPDPGGVDSDDE